MLIDEQSDGTSPDSEVIACVNTASGGVYCSSAGSCNTWGPACITTSPDNLGMCGNYSAAIGIPGPEPAQQSESGTATLNLVGVLGALFASFRFKRVA